MNKTLVLTCFDHSFHYCYRRLILWNCSVSSISYLQQEKEYGSSHYVTCDINCDSAIHLLTSSDYLVAGFKPKLNFPASNNIYLVSANMRTRFSESGNITWYSEV